MNRDLAARRVHEALQKQGLSEWGVRIIDNERAHFLGLCAYKEKKIVLNAWHVAIHPDADVDDTILHEVAHALCPGQGHNDVWKAKAKSLGCTALSPCSHLSLSPDIIEAIKSGADVEVSFEEEVIRRPQYKVTRLQEKCSTCGKVAIYKSDKLIPNKSETKPDMLFIQLECGHSLFKLVPKGTPFHNFQAFGDPTCKHEWSPVEVNTCVLCGRKRPYPFQLEGMKACERALAMGSGFAILDEMGLGKTIQALGYLKYHTEDWPMLFVVKAGLKFQFFSAIMNWMNEENSTDYKNMIVPQIINSSKDIIIPGLKAYIISYDMMVMKTKKLKSGKVVTSGFDVSKIINSDIKTIILDECQMIKNVGSGRTKSVRQICKGRKVITLSGTPWKNRGNELYSMFNMIAPLKFAYHQRFIDEWVDSYWEKGFKKLAGIKNPERFREYIKDIAIRRERKDVMPDLPAITRTKLLVKMSHDEETAYDDAVEQFVNWYQGAVEDATANGINILGKIARLRHVVGIAKIDSTMNYLEEFVEDTDRKIVVFAHHQDVQESLYRQCQERFEKQTVKSDDDDEEDDTDKREKIPVLRLSSEMSGEERYEVQNKFNELPRAILIASTLASGEGLNLQTCADCVMHERQFNPANEEQAEGRFIRIGQKSDTVNAVYAQLVASMDEWLDGLVEKKRLWFHKGMNTGEAPSWNQDSILKELADVIVIQHRRKKGNK